MLKSLIDRPIAVTMSIFVVVVLGFVSLRKLPVSLIPDVDIPIEETGGVPEKARDGPKRSHSSARTTHPDKRIGGYRLRSA